MRRRPRQFVSAWTLALVLVTLGGCFTYSRHDPRVETLARLAYTVDAVDPDHALNAIVAGDPTAQRVIYVHGTPGRAQDWGAFLTEPIEGFEHVAIDRPGFGMSSRTRAVFSLEKQAAAIEPLLVERDGRWPILVGHSLGGPIVARVAADHPDRVAGIVIVAGALDPDLEDVRFIQRLADLPLLELLIPAPLRHANRELIPLENELRLLGERLDRITCPIVIVHGTKDSLVPYANVAYMQRLFAHNPGVTIVTLEGEDHFTVWTSPETIREAIESLAEGR